MYSIALKEAKNQLEELTAKVVTAGLAIAYPTFWRECVGLRLTPNLRNYELK